MKNKFSIAMSLAVILAMLLTSLALAAEFVTAEVTGTANDVTVTQGTSVTSTINLSATGAISCLITSANASTATVDTSYSLSATGTLTTGSPSSAFKFYSDGVPQGQGGNCGVTWDTASAPYSVTATFSAAATTPVGNYTVTLRDSSAGTTDTADITNPSVSGGKLGDDTATTIIMHVIAPVVTDTTAPSTTITLAPAAPNGLNGWYISNVHVTVSSADSDVAETRCVLDPAVAPASFDALAAGCAHTGLGADVATDGMHTIYAASKDTTGNKEAVKSASFKIDKTDPTITFDGPSTSDWHNTDVTANWSCSDATSGPVSASVDATTSGEGLAVAATGTCTDNAGNTANDTQYFKIDQTAPNAPTANVNPAPNGAGWNNSTPVTVSFSSNGDVGSVQSGVVSCSDPSVLTAETAGTLVSGTCSDAAGNTSLEASVTVKIDTTMPNAPSLTPDRSPDYLGGGGWYKNTVTISFSDNGDFGLVQSGVDPSSVPAAVTFNTSGPHTASGTVEDYADNTSLSASLSVQVDATKPSVNISCPVSVTLGSSATASWSASDDNSGLATAASGSVTLDTSSIGPKTATAPTATDNVGLTSDAATCSYSVIYNWTGFFQPVDNLPTLNTVKAGSAVPVKFSLGGNQGLGIFDGYPTFSFGSCSGVEDTVETTVTAGSSSLTYDALAGQYIYVWKTDKAWVGKCGTLTVKLIDGTTHTALFKLK